MKLTQKYLDNLSYKIIGCAIEVHKVLGPGLLESIYEKCFLRELEIQGIDAISQRRIQMEYKGLVFGANLRFDVLVEDLIVVELKAVESVLPVHESILLTYMKLLSKPKGIIINFNCINIFENGQKTFVNELYGSLRYQ